MKRMLQYLGFTGLSGQSSPAKKLILIGVALCLHAPQVMLAQPVCGTNYAPSTAFPVQQGECCFDLGLYTGSLTPTAVTIQAVGSTGPQIGSATTTITYWTATNVTSSYIRYSGVSTLLDCDDHHRQFTFCVTNAYGDVTLHCQVWSNNTMIKTCDTTIHCWDDPCNDIDLLKTGPCSWDLTFVNTNYGNFAVDGFHISAISPSGAGISLLTPPSGWNLTSETPQAFTIAPDDPNDAIPANGTLQGLTFTTDVTCQPVEFMWKTVTSDPATSDSTLCKGTGTITCCDCEPGVFTKIPSGSTGDCCFKFEILNQNPYLKDVTEIQFTVIGGGVISNASHTGVPTFNNNAPGNTVTFQNGTIPLGTTGTGFTLCFDNIPSMPFTVEYSTYWTNGSERRLLCTFQKVLECCDCEGSFVPLPAIPGCGCLYELSTINPDPINKIVLSIPSGTFTCPTVGSSLAGWTASAPGGSTIEFTAPTNTSLPACTLGKLSFGISETALVKYETFFNSEPICDGKELLTCTPPPPCDIQWSTLTPDANCPCRYKVSISNPDDVVKIVLESLDAGVNITSVSVLSGTLTTISGALPGTQVEFIGGTAGATLPAGSTQEIEFCMDGSADVQIKSYETIGMVVCWDKTTLICNPCSCELEELPVIVLDDCPCAKRIRIENPDPVNMIVLTATGGQIMDVNLGPQFSGWQQTMLPSSTITLVAANLTPSLPACTDGFLEICVDQQCTVAIETFFKDPAITTPIPVCDWDIEIKCKVKNCCDPDHWKHSAIPHDVSWDAFITSGSPPVIWPPTAYVVLHLTSDKPVTRVSVINERTWISAPGIPPNGTKDVTGYFCGARASSIPMIPLVPGTGPWSTTPILGTGGFGLHDLTVGSSVALPWILGGGPRVITWNNVSTTGSDCAGSPSCNLGSPTPIVVAIGWRPGEMPTVQDRQFNFRMRVEFTNEDCVTCWDIVDGKLAIPNSAYNSNPTLCSSQLSMTNATDGVLSISVPDTEHIPDDLKLIRVSMAPDTSVRITSMRNETTGKAAIVRDNSAAISVDIGKGQSVRYTIRYDNPQPVLLIPNSLLLSGVRGSPLDSTVYEAFELPTKVVGRVPVQASDPLDSLLVSEADCPSVRTVKMHLMKPRNGEIQWVIWSDVYRSRILATGSPIFTEDAAKGQRSIKSGRHRIWGLPDTSTWKPMRDKAPDFPLQAEVFLTLCSPPNEKVEINVVKITASGDTLSFVTVLVDSIVQSIGNQDRDPVPIARTLLIAPVYPNPAKEHASVQIRVLRAEQRVTLSIKDMAGRDVLRLFENELLTIGDHLVCLDLDGLPAGVYHLVANNGGNIATRPLIIVR
ncbi:MAG: T9SS type A sorting domain-containing protein [Bacteroidia bacterium]|nr:T9SS type A sorting domain-containing protein [Bacteroidia bacterium]